MAIATARQFNRDPSGIKRAAATADVIVTDHGQPTLVVMSYERYVQHISGHDLSLADAVAAADAADIDLPLQRDTALHSGPDL